MSATSRKKRAQSAATISEPPVLQLEPLELLTREGRAAKSDAANTRDYGDIPLLLRANEAAYALGISRALAYRWMASGVLPTVRRGRSIRVPREALVNWIRNNTQQAGD